MVALATAFVRIRADVSKTRDDIEDGLKKAGGEKAAAAKGKSISAAFSKGFSDGGGTFSRVATTMAARATIAASAVAAATPAVTQFVAALAPAAGAVSGLVPAVAGAAAINGTLRVAISGVSDAIGKGLTGSAKQYQKALDGLAPAQRSVVKDLVQLQPQLNKVRSVVAERFMKPLVDDIKPLAQTYLPLARTQMGNLAGDLGRAGSAIAGAARQSVVIKAVKDVFQATGASVRSLTGLFPGLIASVARLVSSSKPLFGGISTLLRLNVISPTK